MGRLTGSLWGIVIALLALPTAASAQGFGIELRYDYDTGQDTVHSGPFAATVLLMDGKIVFAPIEGFDPANGIRNVISVPATGGKGCKEFKTSYDGTHFDSNGVCVTISTSGSRYAFDVIDTTHTVYGRPIDHTEEFLFTLSVASGRCTVRLKRAALYDWRFVRATKQICEVL